MPQNPIGMDVTRLTLSQLQEVTGRASASTARRAGRYLRDPQASRCWCACDARGSARRTGSSAAIRVRTRVLEETGYRIRSPSGP